MICCGHRRRGRHLGFRFPAMHDTPGPRLRPIIIRGARTHNLKNVDVTLAPRRLTVVTGVSGSGKSSLAFDTVYAEGQRRYVESLSAYARQFLERMERPDVDHVEGIPPAIAIRQKNSRPQSALDGRHDDGNPRLSAPAVRTRRPHDLPEVRTRRDARNGRVGRRATGRDAGRARACCSASRCRSWPPRPRRSHASIWRASIRTKTR